MKNIGESIAKIWGIPQSVTTGMLCATLYGNNSIHIENYKNILLYSPTKIHITAADAMIISVIGTSLNIDVIDANSLFISGNFEKIEYMK